MSARSATPSTPASRRFLIPVAGWPGSSGDSARRPSPPSSFRHGAGAARVRRPGAGAVACSSQPSPLARSHMFDAIEDLLAEHADLERRLADPALHADASAARKLGRRYAELTPIVEAYRGLRRAEADIEAARELAAEDEDFRSELVELTERRGELEQRFALLLVPRDPQDDKDVIVEIKAGEGGEESALFRSEERRVGKECRCRWWG